MKRIISLVLALGLLLGLALPVVAEDALKQEKIAKLAELVQAYITQEGFTSYEYHQDDAYYEGKHNLDSALGSCTLYIDVYDDMLAMQATPGLKVPEANRDKMAIFLTMANKREYYSYFQMNYETGEIYCRSLQLVEEVFPSLKEIDVLHYMAVLTLDDYGNGIAKVAGGADPKVAFEETVAEIKAK